MRPLYALFLLGVVVLFFVVSCFPEHGLKETPLPVSVVTGSYRGEYQGGVETFELRSDFKYTQEFRRGDAVVYRNEGTWFIAGKHVVFVNFFRAIESTLHGPSGSKEPEQHGLWVDDRSGYSMVFDGEYNYRISKKR